MLQTVSPDYVPNGSIGSLQSKTSLHDGILHFSLKYDRFDSNLLIKILEVTDLHADEESAILSPYVRVRIYRSHRHLFTAAVENFDTEFKTRMQKFKDNLTFNESFTSSVPVASIKHVSIKFQLCDLDKYSRKVVIGECVRKLKQLHLEDFEEKVFQEKLRDPIEVRIPVLIFKIEIKYQYIKQKSPSDKVDYTPQLCSKYTTLSAI
jgi:hypothetical protein